MAVHRINKTASIPKYTAVYMYIKLQRLQQEYCCSAQMRKKERDREREKDESAFIDEL